MPQYDHYFAKLDDANKKRVAEPLIGERIFFPRYAALGEVYVHDVTDTGLYFNAKLGDYPEQAMTIKMLQWAEIGEIKVIPRSIDIMEWSDEYGRK